MKRHVVLVALASLLASVMVAAQAPANAAPTLRVGIAYDTVGSCYSTGVAAGVARAAREYKLTVLDEFLMDKQGNQAPGAVLDRLAKRSSLVLAVGFYYVATGEAAVANPRANFAVVDAVPQPFAANSQALLFATDEGSFLVGAAAALTSTTSQLGFIGGEARPDIEEFRAGFVAGVDHMGTGAMVERSAYVGWMDPGAAYQSAMEMYEAGIDVIYGVAGGSMIGITEAARDFSAESGTKVWMIGCDCDFYAEVDDSLKPFVLTSMIKRVDVAAYETVKAQATGTFNGGEVEFFDLAGGGVDYATSGGYIDDLVPTLDGLRQEIIDGDIVP